MRTKNQQITWIHGVDNIHKNGKKWINVTAKANKNIVCYSAKTGTGNKLRKWLRYEFIGFANKRLLYKDE